MIPMHIVSKINCLINIGNYVLHIGLIGYINAVIVLAWFIFLLEKSAVVVIGVGRNLNGVGRKNMLRKNQLCL